MDVHWTLKKNNYISGLETPVKNEIPQAFSFNQEFNVYI